MQLAIESIEAKEAKEANKELRDENDELKWLINRIANLIAINKYNNAKAVLNKIKELISDYQSQN